MTILEKIETLKHSIDRYDHYYDSVNNKGSLFLTLNTFLLGGIITGYYSIKEGISGHFDVMFFVFIALISCLASIFYTLWSIIPYLNKQADSLNGSLISFGNVANVSFNSFKQMYDTLTEEKLIEDYLQQAHLLTKGLQMKFCRLRTATYLLGICFSSIIIIGIKILT
jgi:hypothetical protein